MCSLFFCAFSLKENFMSQFFHGATTDDAKFPSDKKGFSTFGSGNLLPSARATCLTGEFPYLGNDGPMTWEELYRNAYNLVLHKHLGWLKMKPLQPVEVQDLIRTIGMISCCWIDWNLVCLMVLLIIKCNDYLRWWKKICLYIFTVYEYDMHNEHVCFYIRVDTVLRIIGGRMGEKLRNASIREKLNFKLWYAIKWTLPSDCWWTWILSAKSVPSWLFSSLRSFRRDDGGFWHITPGCFSCCF